MTLKQHPLSAAFPSMGMDDFQALHDSIMEIGVQNPITLFEGMVIDGWHRYTAAVDLDLPCPIVELAEDVDPRLFVIAQNKARRHVTQAQLAMATTAVYEWKPHGDQRSALSADRAKSTKELAEVAGVGIRSIEQAKAVQTKAAPEVVEAVKSGAIGLPKAAAIAQLPKEEQAAAINKPLTAIKPKKAEPKEPTLAEQVREETGADEFDEAEAEVQELRQGYLLVAEENQRLLDENAALKANGTTEEQEAAAVLIAELRERIRILELDNDSLRTSRDIYLTEANEAKKSAKFWRKKHDQLQAQLAGN